MISMSKYTEEQLVEGCLKHKVKIQKAFFEFYAPRMRSVCRRYAQSVEDAEDILQDGFIKVFQNIGQYKHAGSLEGWIKRIIINTALYHFKKSKNSRLVENFDSINEKDIDSVDEIDEGYEIDSVDFDSNSVDFNLIQQAEFSESELMDALMSVKENFRVVFNLYFIENYRHKEISEMLSIDEKTSRSRLLRARKQIQEELFRRSKSKLVV